MKLRILIVALIAGAALGVALWTGLGRTGAYQAMCEAGLPNFSRPAEVDADELGCAILAPKGTYTGTLTTGFEASSFSSPEFPGLSGPDLSGTRRRPPPGDRAWFNCPTGGCGPELDAQLDKTYPGDCATARVFGGGLATIAVEGWVTVSHGGFGHLDSYPREFFASRIVRVSAPPAALIREHNEIFRRLDLCGKPAG